MSELRLVSAKELKELSKAAYNRGLNDGRREGFPLGAGWGKGRHFTSTESCADCAEWDANRRWPNDKPTG